MRKYAVIAPTFWTGQTGKEIKRRGSEAVVMAMYLLSSPHSNMLGLFYQPLLYAAHETGLGIERASKGLQDCIAAGFCVFDIDTEMVWVYEMAAYQIGEDLSSTDKRCKGVQKDYESLPDCPYLAGFFDRYAEDFHLPERRVGTPSHPNPDEGAYQAPSKPGTGTGTGTGTGRDQEQAPSGAPSPNRPKSRKPKAEKPPETTLAEWLAVINAKGEKAIPKTDPVFAYAAEIGLPSQFLFVAWAEFKAKYTADPVKGQRQKTYVDWRAVFRKAVREGWLKLWYLDGQQYALTTAGQQAQRVLQASQQQAHGEEQPA